MTAGELSGLLSGKADPDTLLPNAAVQALLQNATRQDRLEWKIQKDDAGNIWRVKPESGEMEKIIDAAGPKDRPLRDISAKDAFDLADMRTMAGRAQDLADLDSGTAYTIARWTPEIVKNMIADFVNVENAPDTFFERAAKINPQFFLFSSEMLKSMQGSRPSDRDMEWYLENLPRMDDRKEVKRDKVERMMERLGSKYNNRVNALEAARFDISRFPKLDVASIVEKLYSDKSPESPQTPGELPPGFVLK